MNTNHTQRQNFMKEAPWKQRNVLKKWSKNMQATAYNISWYLSKKYWLGIYSLIHIFVVLGVYRDATQPSTF